MTPQRKRSMRLLQAVTLGAFMLSLTACAVKHNPPVPVVNVDIMSIEAGGVAPFKGMLFSPAYLENYLQWKDGK